MLAEESNIQFWESVDSTNNWHSIDLSFEDVSVDGIKWAEQLVNAKQNFATLVHYCNVVGVGL